MRSTMMKTPLLISRILQHGSSVHGDAEVITWTGAGSRRSSYSEIGRQAARLANALRDEFGVTGDERVGTLMWNNAEHLVTYLAVPSMGAVLHTLNIRLFPEQLIYIANHAEDRVIIVDSTLVPLLAGLLPHLTTVRHIVVVASQENWQGVTEKLQKDGVTLHSWDELLAGRSEAFDWPVVDENDAAALCYTSGTTGNPKGVAYSHRSIYLHSMQVCTAESFGLGPQARSLCIVPMFHAMAWGLPYAALMSGASLLMPDRFLQAAPLAQMIAAERPTFAGAVPTIFSDLLAYLDANPTDTSSLKEVVIGGSACPPALMHAFKARYDIDVIHAWGMTETSPLGSVARVPFGVEGPEAWGFRYTQGRVPASVEARIVGPAGEVMPNDGKAVGELQVRGPWITAQYVGEDVPDPDKFEDGWLRTGDVGTLTPNGYLALTDRAKDVIKSGGEWISSVDLENALMAHPAVLEACVVGVPDEKWGERPLATVVLRAGATADAGALREFLSGKVARWQLPERWSFIEAVPKTSVGKFDKKRVRASYADGGIEVVHIDG
jgi:fatty-acyl-CoA synthase